MPWHYSVRVIPFSTHPEQANNSKTLRETSEAVMGMSRDKHKQEMSLPVQMGSLTGGNMFTFKMESYCSLQQ